MVVQLIKKLINFNMKQTGPCLFFEYELQGLKSRTDSFCGPYCLYVTYLTTVIGIDVIKPAVLTLYYQRFSLQNDVTEQN